MTPVTVSLVLVSHSRALVQGVVELARQMAPDVLLLPAGGTDDGRLGTGFDLIQRAVDDAVGDGRCAVVLTDLGSALLTTESVLELAEPAVVARVRVVDAPFVEGAVEAAVVAQAGASLDEVADAARRAGLAFGSGDDAPTADPGGSTGTSAAEATPGAGPTPDDEGATASVGPARGTPTPEEDAAQHAEGDASSSTARGTAVLRNRLGLHARPAAQLARTASGFTSTIAVNGADARSVLSLVALGAVGGQQLVVTAAGPDAARAVRAVVGELEQGFGEA